MSRSFRKINIVSYIGGSDKSDKSLSNRRLRNLVKIRIKKQHETLPLLREISNVWTFKKDGKHFWFGTTKKDLSK